MPRLASNIIFSVLTIDVSVVESTKQIFIGVEHNLNILRKIKHMLKVILMHKIGNC